MKNNGFPGLFIAAQQSDEYLALDGSCIELGVDAYIQFQPSFASFNPIHKLFRKTKGLSLIYYLARKLRRNCRVLDYDDVWEKILAFTPKDPRLIAGAFTGWDNSPRRSRTGLILSYGYAYLEALRDALQSQ